MVLEIHPLRLLESIYKSHRNDFHKSTCVIFHDTKGHTRFKLCHFTTDEAGTYNGFGYYIVSVQYFYKNGYYPIETLLKMKSHDRKRKDYIMLVIDKLLELFN